MAASKKPIQYIIGLGNPGEQYVLTYHNVGFLAVDFLTEQKTIYNQILHETSSPWHVPSNKHFTYTATETHIFIKPLTFMNRSGMAVQEILKYFNTNLENIIILHDDFDLPIGTYRKTDSSGSAGHKGVTSIISALHTEDFHRIRIGIHPNKEEDNLARLKAEEYVLCSITRTHQTQLLSIFKEIKKHINVLS
ncbi:MAG: aminoacyl-tRNA hydrolase [bacterium]